MKWLRRLLLSGIVFLLPLAVLAGAANLTVRMPDFYQYEFNNDNISENLDFSVSNAEFASVFSDFMWGKEKELSFETELSSTGEVGNVFTEEEQQAMEKIRRVQNIAALIGTLALVSAVASYYVTLRDGGKEVLRRAFLASAAVLCVYGVLCVCGIFLSGPASALREFLIGSGFSEEQVLYLVLDRNFVIHGAVATAAISAVCYIIIGMITWSLTRPYRMFGRERRRM